MNLLGPPLEVLISAVTSVFGRAVCFLLTCSVGSGAGVLIAHWIDDWPIDEWAVADVGRAMLIIPTAFRSFFAHWGIVVYPLCLLTAFVFIRFELSFKWLVVPFLLLSWESAALTSIHTWIR